MINDIFTIFSFDFVQRAFIGGLLISLCCALLGVILVLKRFSMIGDGLSHISFGSLAIATVLGISPMKFTIPVVIVAAIFLLRIRNSSKINGDSAIAMISVSSLAIGVLLISSTTGGNTDIYNYMFGSMLALKNSDVMLIVILSLAILLVYLLTYNKMFVATFDEKFAKSAGINTNFYNTLVAVLSALVIVTGIKMMGSMLISALIVFPALTAMKLFKTFKSVTVCSALISVFNFIIGMIVSIILDTPSGATIVITDVLIFVIFVIIGKISNK